MIYKVKSFISGNLYDRDKKKIIPVKNVKIDIAKSRNDTTTIWLDNIHFTNFFKKLWAKLQQSLNLNI